MSFGRPTFVHYNRDMHKLEAVPHGRPSNDLLRTLQSASLALLLCCLLVSGCNVAPLSTEPTPVSLTPTAVQGALQVDSTPTGATISIAGESAGITPARVALDAGSYEVRLAKTGYATVVVQVQVRPGEVTLVSERLLDEAAPQVSVEPWPARVAPDAGLKLVSHASDNETVAHMRLLVDGQTVAEVAEADLRHNLDTRALASGSHTLVVEAEDTAGNVGRAQGSFEIVAALSQTATPTASTSTPTVAPTSLTSEQPTDEPATATPAPISVSWSTITIATYGYAAALYTDAAAAGHPYALLHRDLVQPPTPQTYRVLKVRNDYIELTFLPELGGRIYQCRFLPTGQDLFYNNQVIKPSYWGPADQGWWLAVGGMEWCTPVDEHGYVSAVPWDVDVQRREDGAVDVVLTLEELSRQLEIRVDVILRQDEAGFTVRTSIHNPNAEARSFQYWINAMLSPGSSSVQPTLGFYVPASWVIVHSTGDPDLPGAHGVLAWSIYANRDLSSYANWRNWLGFFATSLRAPFTAVYDRATQLGMVRVFPDEVARGAKLFGFGSGFADVGSYTDDGTQYVEMWGGLTPTFWDYASIEAGATQSWEERWYVISQSGGPSWATGDVSVSVQRDGTALDIMVASPGEHYWTLQLTSGGEEFYRQRFSVRPDLPFQAHAVLPEGTFTHGYSVHILDDSGAEVTSFTP